MGLAPLENELVYSYVGNGVPALIRRALPAESEQEIERALQYFLTYYGEHKLDNTTLYPGVRDALDRFYEHGVKMAVLTNKPVDVSTAILDGLGVGKHFLRIYGGNSLAFKKPNPIGVETLLAETGVARERALMVGDSGVDVKTARNANIKCCGVTYGFQPETLVEEPPDILVDRMGDLADQLLASKEKK
jgi:phosphoglycolate phosphatase